MKVRTLSYLRSNGESPGPVDGGWVHAIPSRPRCSFAEAVKSCWNYLEGQGTALAGGDRSVMGSVREGVMSDYFPIMPASSQGSNNKFRYLVRYE